MNRSLAYLVALIALALVAPGPVRADDAADRAALEAELAAIMGEILESEEVGNDPFEAGAVPELVVLGSSNVAGEVAPCG